MRNPAYHLPDAPDVVAHAPAGFDARGPLHLVVFLHGYHGCARVLMRAGSQPCKQGDTRRQGWQLAAHHDAAGTNSIFVIPQLAFMARSGRPGCFAKPGCFKAFVQELLSETLAEKLRGPRKLDDLASITLVAHSAGFETALAILEHGGLDKHVHNVVLMDALYSGADAFGRWLDERADPRARIVSIYLGSGKTYRESRRLYRRMRKRLGPDRVARVGDQGLLEAITSHRVVIVSGRAPHRLVPQNYLSDVLAALGLPKRRH